MVREIQIKARKDQNMGLGHGKETNFLLLSIAAHSVTGFSHLFTASPVLLIICLILVHLVGIECYPVLSFLSFP